MSVPYHVVGDSILAVVKRWQKDGKCHYREIELDLKTEKWKEEDPYKNYIQQRRELQKAEKAEKAAKALAVKPVDGEAKVPVAKKVDAAAALDGDIEDVLLGIKELNLKKVVKTTTYKLVEKDSKPQAN